MHAIYFIHGKIKKKQEEKTLELLVPFDTETTGMVDWKVPSTSEHQPHIVQIAAHIVDADTRRITQTLDVIVRPEETWKFDPEALNTHGITKEYAMDVGIPERKAVDMFLEFWNGNRTCIAHNRLFDERIIRIAIKRYFGDKLADQWKAQKNHCTMLTAKPIMQLPIKGRYGYKNPKLIEAYKFFTGKELKDAHQAIADVNACLELYWAIQDYQAKQDKAAG